MPARIRVNSIAIAIADRDSNDVDEIAAEQANIVIRRIYNGKVANEDVATKFQGDGFRPAAAVAGHVNSARSENGDVLNFTSANEGEIEIGCLVIRKGVVIQLFVFIEVVALRRRHECSAIFKLN